MFIFVFDKCIPMVFLDNCFPKNIFIYKDAAVLTSKKIQYKIQHLFCENIRQILIIMFIVFHTLKYLQLEKSESQKLKQFDIYTHLESG